MATRRMRAAPAHTAKRIHQFVECAEAGMTVEETAQQMGMTVPHLYGWRHTIHNVRGIKLPKLSRDRTEVQPTDPKPATRRRTAPAKLSAIRKKAGLSQSGLARELGVTAAAVNHWEQGRAEPTPVHLAMLQAVCNMRTMSTVDIVSF